MSVGHGSYLIPAPGWPEPLPSAVRAHRAELQQPSDCDAFFISTRNATAPTSPDIPRWRRPPSTVVAYVPESIPINAP
jgi:hypothetical protein